MAEYPWINVGDDFARSSNVVPIFERAGVRLPKKVVETDSVAYVIAHLLRSDSLSYQPRHVQKAGGLTALDIDGSFGGLSHFKVVAAHRKDKPLSVGAELLLKHLAAEPRIP